MTIERFIQNKIFRKRRLNKVIKIINKLPGGTILRAGGKGVRRSSSSAKWMELLSRLKSSPAGSRRPRA